MASNFPTSLDTYATLTDSVDDVLAAHANDRGDAIENLQIKVGIDSSAVTTTLDYFLKHASGAYRTHTHDGTSDDGANVPLANTTGTLGETRGGTNQTTYTLGNILYASASNTLSKLAGNTTTTKKFLTQTGDGAASAAPGWNTLVNGDIPTALSSKTYEGLTITTSTGTLTISNGKTATISNTLTLAGTDSTTITFQGTDTYVGRTTTDTLTNKTLTSPVLTTPQINDTSADHQYVFAVSELAADRTVTLPLLTGADTFVFQDHTQTLTNKTLTSPTITTGVAATSFDMNGTELILDADADTSITADTDDQIDIKIATADDFQFTANTFTALSGSSIATNTITETTAASGVTIDSLLVKDGGLVAAGTVDLNAAKLILDADADTSITADTDDQIDIELAGADDFRFTANTFTSLSGSTIATNTIAETTAGSGVTIDGLLVKDSGLSINRQNDTSNTTAIVVPEVGWGYIQGDGSTAGRTKTVTFPSAYSGSARPVVLVSYLGLYTNASAPTAIQDFTGDRKDTYIGIKSVTLTGFTVTMQSPVAWNTDEWLGFTWMALGA